MTDGTRVQLAAAITAAWLSNEHTKADADAAAALLLAVHGAMVGQEAAAVPVVNRNQPAPAVSIRKSLSSPDHIVSMIDGKPYKALKRHLTANGLTPDEYRARYNLPASYPMVAPSYREARSELSKRLGLGKGRPRTVDGAAAERVAEGRTKGGGGGRKSIAEAKAAAKAHLG